MKKLLLFIFFVFIYCQFPLEYKLIKSSGHLNRYEHNSIKGQLANNAVIDIKYYSDSLYFFGTGNGLSYADILPDGTRAGHMMNYIKPLMEEIIVITCPSQLIRILSILKIIT